MRLKSISKGKQGDDFNAHDAVKILLLLHLVLLLFYAPIAKWINLSGSISANI